MNKCKFVYTKGYSPLGGRGPRSGEGGYSPLGGSTVEDREGGLIFLLLFMLYILSFSYA